MTNVLIFDKMQDRNSWGKWIQASRNKRISVFDFFAAPGRAQPATVGLPASGPVQTEFRTGHCSRIIRFVRNFR
jgi:hypothetical protein